MFRPAGLASLILTATLTISLLLLAVQDARADSRNVGLGVALGAGMRDLDIHEDTSLAWGFFVDIPLLDTFFITPAALLYEMGSGDNRRAITDVDLNFKFIVPLDPMRLGVGVTAGLTTGLGDYLGHYGVLAYGSWNLVANVDLFVMLQHKRLAHGGENIGHTNGYLGGMFRF